MASTLAEIDISKVHYVRVPEDHIVIDFDLRDESGAKSQEANLEAASKWPPTYAEWSKSGAGIHLHYKADPSVDYALEYAPGIEIKRFRGKASLRRRMSGCNGYPILCRSEERRVGKECRSRWSPYH